MAFNIASNRQTQQPSLDGQSVKCILASRAFIKTQGNSDTFPMAERVDESTPSGWTDLGAIMRSKVSMEYTKEYNEVRSGLDGVYQVSYVTAKSCSWSFALDNYDSAILAELTGATRSYVTSGNQSGYKLWVGKEDTIVRQLFLVGTNKIDSKEHQYWSPAADIRFAWEEDGDAIVIRVTAQLQGKKFTDDPITDDQKKLSFYEVCIWE